MHKSLTLTELAVGDSETLTVTLDDERVQAFAMATGDTNPIHLDETYAAESPFGRRVVHGVLLTGVVSGLLGTQFPGLGTVAREMNAKFSGPIYVGETITVTAEVAAIREKLNMVTLKYTVQNEAGKTAVKGTAVVLPRQA